MTRQTLISQYLRKTLTLLWALAIFWFYLGNLINFHENRIWGKNLIPTCFTNSSINKKDGDLIKNAGKDSPSCNFPDSLYAVPPLSNNIFSSLLSGLNIIKRASEITIKPAVLAYDHKLRGPPTV